MVQDVGWLLDVEGGAHFGKHVVLWFAFRKQPLAVVFESYLEGDARYSFACPNSRIPIDSNARWDDDVHTSSDTTSDWSPVGNPAATYTVCRRHRIRSPLAQVSRRSLSGALGPAAQISEVLSGHPLLSELCRRRNASG